MSDVAVSRLVANSRFMELREIEIRFLSPALRDNFLSFLDGDAFADNRRWAACERNRTDRLLYSGDGRIQMRRTLT